MKKSKSLYHCHRFPAGGISCAVRWYFRFQLSVRDIEELLLERGAVETYETIRYWCDKFGVSFAQRCIEIDLQLRQRQIQLAAERDLIKCRSSDLI